MKVAARSQKRATTRGGVPGSAAERHRAAAARAAALCLLLLGGFGCAAPPPPTPAPEPRLDGEAYRAARAALDLYAAREYALSARRFGVALRLAEDAGDDRLAREVLVGSCMSWLEVRQPEPLAACTARLAEVRRQETRRDPGLNTLIALGSIAGSRPLPPFAHPDGVRPVLRAAAGEAER